VQINRDFVSPIQHVVFVKIQILIIRLLYQPPLRY